MRQFVGATVVDPVLKWILFTTATQCTLSGMALLLDELKCEDYLTVFLDITQCSFVTSSFGCFISLDNKCVSSEV